MTHSEASDVLVVLVGTQKHEDLWVWGRVAVVDTIQRKLSISRHSAVTPNPSAPRGRAATFRLPRWHKHAALQLWARRRSGVKTQMLLCAGGQRKRGSGGRRRPPRSSALLCLFACSHNRSNFCSLKTYKCVSIRGFATRRNKQVLCGPELLLLHKQMINPVLTSVRLAANQLSHLNKRCFRCWRHWALQRNIHAPLIQSIVAGIITLWLWIMTAVVVTWQKWCEDDDEENVQASLSWCGLLSWRETSRLVLFFSSLPGGEERWGGSAVPGGL